MSLLHGPTARHHGTGPRRSGEALTRAPYPPGRAWPTGTTRRLTRWLATAGAGALLAPLVSVAGAGGAAAVVPTTTNNPPISPHSLIAFPQRDFVSITGYQKTQRLTVDIVHPDGTVRTAGSGLIPKDDPSTADTTDGILEVNHPGGYCWQEVTPDIRPGDKLRVTDDVTTVADETTVANVTAERPVQTAAGTVVVHGTAVGRPPVAQLEQRLVAPGQNFANGKRTLRAASARIDGTLAYDDAVGSTWTATYTGLSAADVDTALGAESRILWLGSDPAAGVESTIYENGAGVAGGPSSPCTAPLEKLPPPPGADVTPPGVPSGLTSTVTDSSVALSWTAPDGEVATSY